MNKYTEVENAFAEDLISVGQVVCYQQYAEDCEVVIPFNKANKNSRIYGVSLHNVVFQGGKVAILKQGLIDWSSHEDIPIGQTMFVDDNGFPTWKKTNFVYGEIKSKERGRYQIKVNF